MMALGYLRSREGAEQMLVVGIGMVCVFVCINVCPHMLMRAYCELLKVFYFPLVVLRTMCELPWQHQSFTQYEQLIGALKLFFIELCAAVTSSLPEHCRHAVTHVEHFQ